MRVTRLVLKLTPETVDIIRQMLENVPSQNLATARLVVRAVTEFENAASVGQRITEDESDV